MEIRISNPEQAKAVMAVFTALSGTNALDALPDEYAQAYESFSEQFYADGVGELADGDSDALVTEVDAKSAEVLSVLEARF